MTVRRIGGWQLPLPDRFQPVPGRDGEQFSDGVTIVYASEMRVSGQGKSPPPAAELHAVARERMAPEHELANGRFGGARVDRTANGIRVVASREATGSVLTLVADTSTDHVDEVLAIWRGAVFLA